MADQKRILIVDDNFEVALFLRTTLEIVWPDFEVINVPSGEEGLLEVGQDEVDLVISDLVLPGIDGLEFIERVRHLSPDTPIIIITGENSPALHRRARSLKPDGFYLKPLDVEELTQTVRRLLDQESLVLEPRTETPESIPPQAIRRLGGLRIDTGAHYAMIVDRNGRCLVSDGQVSGLDTNQVALLLATELASSFELARALNAPQPFSIDYHAGAVHDLYAVNVGTHYLIALIFDAQRGRGQIGAVWVYARRAVREMLDMIAIPAAPEPAKPPPPVEFEERKEPEPSEPVAEPAVARPDEAEFTAVPEEVNAFWDSVLSPEDSTEGGAEGFGGISLEEARAQGILPPDFFST